MRPHTTPSHNWAAAAAASKKLSSIIASQPTAADEQQLFERWLQIPACPSEAELVRAATSSSGSNSKGHHQHFLVEPGFDTSDDAVFSAAVFSQQDRVALQPVVWRRVTGTLVKPTEHYHSFSKGCLCRSTWFLGALAAVATKQALLLNLIISDEQAAAAGLYTFQLFKHGEWHQVVVDNRLPCLEVQQRLAFASSSTPQELWPSLVEKAYARLHGGYAAIATGSVADALVDLTGGIVDTISLSGGYVSEGAIWLRIMHTLQTGNIAVCVAERGVSSTAAAAAAAAGEFADIVVSLGGLQANSPYSILAAKVLPSGLKLLRLHNPWGPDSAWQGAWGPGAPEWVSEEGQAVLAGDEAMAEGLEDPATFWCSFWDFLQVFSTLHLLQLRGSHTQEASVVSGWSGGGLAGNCRQYSSNIAQGQQPGMLSAQHQQQHLQQHSQQQQNVLRSAGRGSTQSCQQVPPECLDWACRPQFKLVTAVTCEVVLSLGQHDPRLCSSSSPPTNPNHHLQPLQQQQHTPGEALQIGLRVSHASHNSPALRTKALAAAGFSRPGTSMIMPSTVVCPGSRGSSRGGSRSKSPSRPGTAPVGSLGAGVALTAADEAAASSRLRVWVPELQPAVADSGLSSSRDVVVRFVAEAGRNYSVMPYTRDTSDTGPFVLRAWAPCSVQLEQLPAPYSLTPRGQWLGSSAGGSRAHVTWASNPHILITCPREATALLCLQRPDVCNSLVPQPFDASGCISLTLCQPQASAATGRLGTPAVAVSQALLSAAAAAAAANSKVVGATDGSSMDRAALLVKLQPDTPYALVPSTAQPGVEAPWELVCFSSYPLELSVLPRQCSIHLSGSWQEGTAGGSNLHSSWIHNPAFTLRLERKALCRITLTRSGSWKRNQPLGHMIGLSALRLPSAAAAATPAEGSQQQQQQHQHSQQQSQRLSHSSQQHHSLRPQQQPANSLTMLKQHQLQEAAFVPMQSCQVEWELPGGVPLLLIPCTYSPGVKGSFSLSVTTAPPGGSSFSCEPVSGGLAALLAATGTRVTRLTQQ